MAIRKVTVTEQWLLKNTQVKQFKKHDDYKIAIKGRPQVRTCEPRRDIYAPTGKISPFPLTYETYPNNKSHHAIHLATAITVFVGFDEDYRFHQSIIFDERKLDKEDGEKLLDLWLYTDSNIDKDEEEVDYGLLFETEQQAIEFEKIHKSTEQYYKSAEFINSPFYMCLSKKTLKIFTLEAEEYENAQNKKNNPEAKPTEEEKGEVLEEPEAKPTEEEKGEVLEEKEEEEEEVLSFPALNKNAWDVIQNPGALPLAAPDRSNWKIIIFNSEFTERHFKKFFPGSLTAHNALLSKSHEYDYVRKAPKEKPIKVKVTKEKPVKEATENSPKKHGFLSFFKKKPSKRQAPTNTLTLGAEITNDQSPASTNP